MEKRKEGDQPLLLLVEDDADAVELFQLVFRRIVRDWQVVRVADGLEAVHYMMENSMPDLIVTDLQMPRMTGQELIAWVRANIHDSRIPILVLSSRSEPRLEDRLHKIGADDYICKFSPLNDLQGALSRHTRRTFRDDPISTTPSLI